MFKDVLDMREAGIKYETMLEEVSKHYNASIMGVANIDKAARSLKEKHAGIAYNIVKTSEIGVNGNYEVSIPVKTQDGIIIPKYTDLLATEKPNTFKINELPPPTYPPYDSRLKKELEVVLPNLQDGDLIPSGEEIGIVGDNTNPVNMDEYPDHTFQGAAPQQNKQNSMAEAQQKVNPSEQTNPEQPTMEDLGPIS
jgi:hypothetical protein